MSYGTSEEARQAGGQDNTETYSWLEVDESGRTVQRWGYRNPDNTGRDWERGFEDAGNEIWDWLNNQDAKDAAQKQEEDRIGRWDALDEAAPTVGQLSTGPNRSGSTDEYGNLLMGDSRLEGMNQGQQQAAMAQLAGVGADLHQISEGGGYTPEDRAQMTAQRLRQGQALSGANAAAMQQMQARGTGGGGAELASRLGGSAAYANANAIADAQIGAAGQQRAFQALQAQGQIGQAQGQIAGQMYGQEAQRRAALDAYNQSQYDWRRGRNEQNTERRYRTDRDRADAYQQQFGNRLATTSGATNYSNQNRQHAEDTGNDRVNTGIAAIGDAWESVTS